MEARKHLPLARGLWLASQLLLPWPRWELRAVSTAQARRSWPGGCVPCACVDASSGQPGSRAGLPEARTCT